MMAVGMIFDPHHAERIVRDGDADLIALARGVLSDPHWAWRAAATLDADVDYPVQYVRGYKSNWLRAQRGTRRAGSIAMTTAKPANVEQRIVEAYVALQTADRCRISPSTPASNLLPIGSAAC